jgi:hypothetical protein
MNFESKNLESKTKSGKKETNQLPIWSKDEIQSEIRKVLANLFKLPKQKLNELELKERLNLKHKQKILEILLEISEEKVELTKDKVIIWLSTVFGRDSIFYFIENNSHSTDSPEIAGLDYIDSLIQNYKLGAIQNGMKTVNTILPENYKNPIDNDKSNKANSPFFLINDIYPIDELGLSVLAGLFNNESLLKLIISESVKFKSNDTKKDNLEEQKNIAKYGMFLDLVKVGLQYYELCNVPLLRNNNEILDMYYSIFSEYYSKFGYDKIIQKWFSKYNLPQEEINKFLRIDYPIVRTKEYEIPIRSGNTNIKRNFSSPYIETTKLPKYDHLPSVIDVFQLIENSFITKQGVDQQIEIKQFQGYFDELKGLLLLYQSTFEDKAAIKKTEIRNTRPQSLKFYESEIKTKDAQNRKNQNRIQVLVQKIIQEFQNPNNLIQIKVPSLNHIEEHFFKGRSEDGITNLLTYIAYFPIEQIDYLPVIIKLIDKLSIQTKELNEIEQYKFEIPKKIELSNRAPKISKDIAKRTWANYWDDRLNSICIKPDFFSSLYDKTTFGLLELARIKSDAEIKDLKLQTKSDDLNTRVLKSIVGFGVPLSILFSGVTIFSNLIKTNANPNLEFNEYKNNSATISIPLGTTNPPQTSLYKDLKLIDYNRETGQTIRKSNLEIKYNTKDLMKSATKENYEKIKSGNPTLIEVSYLKLYSGQVPFPAGEPVAIISEDGDEIEIAPVKSSGGKITSIWNIKSTTNNVRILYKPQSDMLGKTLKLPFYPSEEIDKSLDEFYQKKPITPRSYWKNEFNNQEFASKIYDLHALYDENGISNVELVDKLQKLISSQSYDFNDVNINYSNLDTTSNNIIEALEKQGIVCEHSSILFLYIYSTITRQGGGFVNGYLPKKDGSFSTVNGHVVPMVRIRKGVYKVIEPTPGKGPGIEKLKQADESMNNRDNFDFSNFKYTFVVIGTGFVVLVLIPKYQQKQQQKFEMKMEILNKKIDSVNSYLSDNFNNIVTLSKLLQPAIYGKEPIDREYLKKHLLSGNLDLEKPDYFYTVQNMSGFINSLVDIASENNLESSSIKRFEVNKHNLIKMLFNLKSELTKLVDINNPQVASLQLFLSKILDFKD